MGPDLHRLRQLLQHLRELEQQPARTAEAAGFESAEPNVRDQLTTLLHTLRDGSYWHGAMALDQRHAS